MTSQFPEWSEYDQLMDEMEFCSEAMQRPYYYLKILDQGPQVKLKAFKEVPRNQMASTQGNHAHKIECLDVFLR